ncbi:hypothetical protein PISMIDRAFT_688002, partial [Pisolithus microcarpus 441]
MSGHALDGWLPLPPLSAQLLQVLQTSQHLAWKVALQPVWMLSTNAKLVVFLCGLWLKGSVKIKWGRGSVHLEGLGQR